MPGQQFVEDGPETVDVGRRAEPAPAQGLLGGHVGRRAHDHARPRQAVVLLDAPGQAKIGDVGLSVAVNQDVARLEVAVQNAALMGVMDRPSHGSQHLSRARGLHAGRRAAEAPALDQFHGEVVLAVLLADLVDGHDVGVIERCGGLGFALEALNVGRGGELSGENHLDGDQAIEAQLQGLVHHSHAAARQFFQKHVVADCAFLDPRRQARCATVRRSSVGG